MAAIEETPCGSRHGGDCCISSRRDDHDRFSRRHGGSHTCNKKLAAMAAPTPAKKLAAMAAPTPPQAIAAMAAPTHMQPVF